jgi:sec-independent protein translocase protein TatC
MARLKSVSHEDELSLVDHLDELRTRIIVSVIAFVAASGLCFWQKERTFEIAKAPIPDGVPLTTFGVTEPFTTTLTISTYFGLVLALPVILYQAYAYVLPAFSEAERKSITPLMLLAPLLFIGGAVFAYFVVMPPAVDFLLDFNNEEFNPQLRARDYFTFFATMLIALGIIFEIPIAVLAVTRLGIVTPDQLAQNRRYAILVIAIVAALLPSIDPVTLMLEIIPILVLYELSILLARAIGTPKESSYSEPSAQEP